MSNVIRDNIAPPLDKVADPRPYDSPSTQWGKLDANSVFQFWRDTLSCLRSAIDVRNFGGVGDGVTDDGPALMRAIAAAATVLPSGAYGGFVDLPEGVWLTGSQLVLPNGVGLRGAGTPATIIRAKSTFNGTSLIRNQNQDGTQEFAFLESLSVQGNKGGGAQCTTAVVDFVSLFVNSYIRDVIIQDGSNVGLRIGAAGSPGGGGPMKIEDVWCLNNDGHGFLGEEVAGNAGGFSGVVCVHLVSEHQGSNKSAIYLKGLGGSAQWNFYNTHIEMGGAATGRTGITIDGVLDVQFHGVQLLTGNPANVTAGIAITNVARNVRFDIRGVSNPNLINPVINDAKNSVTIGAINAPCYVAPDANVRGGLRFTPHTTAGSKSLVAQNSIGTDVVWFDDTGAIAGASPSGSSLDVASNTADGATGRVLALVNQARSRAFGFFYPDSTFLRFRYFTGGFDIWDADNAGNMRVWQLLTLLASLRGSGARATAPSTSGHTVGEIVFNADPVAGGKIGWVCVTSGTPDVWKAWGPIDA